MTYTTLTENLLQCYAPFKFSTVRKITLDGFAYYIAKKKRTMLFASPVESDFAVFRPTPYTRTA